MSNDLTNFAARIQQLTTTAVPRMTAQMVEAAAHAVAESVNHEINADIPHRTVAGGRVGVKVKMRGATAVVSEDGPLHLVSNPTEPHEIRPKHKKALQLADGSVRGSVAHPGTKGKRTWQKGVAKAQPLVNRALSVEMTRIPHLFAWGRTTGTLR